MGRRQNSEDTQEVLKKRESLGFAEDGQWRCSGGILGQKELEVARRWGSGGALLGLLLGENTK